MKMDYDDERRDDGTFRPRTPRSASIEALEDNRHTTREIADAVDMRMESARYRLKSLAEDGVVDGIKAGNTIIWALEDAEAGDE